MRVFIIAEIGINHNGDVKLAKKMIEVAKTCGADAVKFQKRDINLVYSKEMLAQKRESPWGTTQYDQKKKLEFEEKDPVRIAIYTPTYVKKEIPNTYRKLLNENNDMA